jgi:hypothetical protein
MNGVKSNIANPGTDILEIEASFLLLKKYSH